MGYLYLALAITAEVIGTTALQASQGFTKPLPSAIVVIGYGLAFSDEAGHGLFAQDVFTSFHCRYRD